MSIGNYEQIKSILLDLWNKAKARDISSFLYSKDKATNTKTLKAKRADGSLGDISTLTEAQVTHAVEEDPGFVTFTIGEDLVTLISNNATAAWQLVASLQ